MKTPVPPLAPTLSKPGIPLQEQPLGKPRGWSAAR